MTPIFSKEKMQNPLRPLKEHWTGTLSGQRIIMSKSDLCCSPNTSKEDQEALASDFQVNLVDTPSKYLGVNFKLRGGRVADFQFLAEKLISKLQGWKAKLLSQAGRTTLLSSVMQSLYTFSCFKVPETICDNSSPSSISSS